MLGKYTFILISCLLVTACGSAGKDWPKLTDPLPDPADRERVQETADSSAAEYPVMDTGEGEEKLSPEEAARRLVTLRTDIETARAAYETALTAFADRKTAPDDVDPAVSESLGDLWQTSQLMLTRLSSAVSRLDTLTAQEGDMHAATRQEATDLQAALEAFIVAERKRLTSEEPGREQ
ncbi:hypothetical protein GCM10017044_02980 [Kordiimonas sediminis]|uniref:Uncharacterized protein n=1 Tax=Kordiimonas sediminis TaxID=1735581 RepID=A0A919E4A6_9PROT|nr:hypothetical protein [Kordiimonas sediminis]GHF12433.1 hypothetical protein GCM10017044_02980 [Kordiimonas sediminis]